MKTSHLLCGFFGVAAIVAGAAIGCSSGGGSAFDDGSGDAGDDAQGQSFGGRADAGKAPCVNLQCQQKACGGGDTTVSGTVFAPNGTLPLYNAIVYVPNAPLSPFTRGATCDKCGTVSGDPVVTALSDASGNFTLHNVPVGTNIPLVIQVGKWRRQTVIPSVGACVDTKLTDPELTRLPKKQAEGDMPEIALTTGNCDRLGCMLPKVGIDPSEFGKHADGYAKAVHVYQGASGGSPAGSPLAHDLWSDATRMKEYDMLVLSCECSEALANKDNGNGGASAAAMTNYLNGGGRIFTTDFQYTWYRYTPDATFKSATSIRGGAPGGGSPMTIETTFPKGQALKDWFNVVTPGSNGSVTPDVVFGNLISVDPTKTQEWAQSPNPLAGPRVFTVNLPAGLPADQQCGKGVHIDAHLNQQGTDTVDATYPANCKTAMKDGEKLLAFFFFDLAACIQNDSQPPAPPPVK